MKNCQLCYILKQAAWCWALRPGLLQLTSPHLKGTSRGSVKHRTAPDSTRFTCQGLWVNSRTFNSCFDVKHARNQTRVHVSLPTSVAYLKCCRLGMMTEFEALATLLSCSLLTWKWKADAYFCCLACNRLPTLAHVPIKVSWTSLDICEQGNLKSSVPIKTGHHVSSLTKYISELSNVPSHSYMLHLHESLHSFCNGSLQCCQRFCTASEPMDSFADAPYMYLLSWMTRKLAQAMHMVPHFQKAVATDKKGVKAVTTLELCLG